MLMQFDPFREFDRLAEQAMSGTRTPRAFPMDGYRRGDEFVVSFDLPAWTRGRSTSPLSSTF
jgi:HSP20 family protein